MSGHTSDDYLLSVAAELAEATNAEVHVMVPLVVPRDLPLQAPLPREEELAMQAFDKAKTLLAAERVPHKPRLERARDIGTAIYDVAEEVSASQVIVALSNAPDIYDEMSKLVKSVMSKVERPLMFVRSPRA